MHIKPTDHRARVLEVLESHRAFDGDEAQDVDFITRFVRTHADCFGKDNSRGHITGSAFVLDPTGRILLTFHRKLQRWLQLGGHSEVDEVDPSQTARREALEESGLDFIEFHPTIGRSPIDIDVHLIPENTKEGAHHHLDFRYVFFAPDPDAIVCGEESIDLRWFELTETANLGFDPALERAIGKLTAMGSLSQI